MKRAIACLALLAIFCVGCRSAPEPGDLAGFCSLLESGSGLSPAPTAEDLDRLALVAPPAVRPTIEALQNRARDFDDLLAESPPNLEALFNARFDPQANTEQAALDRYALSSCGIAADRPPATRWTSFVAENHQDAAWADLITAQFVVTNDRVETATIVFRNAPEPISLVEEVCSATAAFLIADSADPGRIQVLIGPVVALEIESPAGLCRLP